VDRELIERAQRGDEVAFATLVQQRSDRLHAVAYHILRDDDRASDAAQQAIIEIWRRLPQLRDPERFDAWSYRIVVRAAYAQHRQAAAWRLRSPVIHSIATDPQTTDVDDRDQLERLFERLSVDHRAVLVLKHYVGLTDAEIAAALRLREGTVRSRLFYAMRDVRRALRMDADRPPEGQ